MLLRNLRLYFLILCAISLPCVASAQPKLLDIGIKLGAPLNDLVDAEENKTVPFTIGGVAELNLPVGFAVEANALYRRLGYRVVRDNVFNTFEYDNRLNAWEFPILLKSYPLGRNPLLQPFLSAGISFRRVTGDFPGVDGSVGNTGLVLGAGLRNGPGRIKFSPELRYTRWNDGSGILRQPLNAVADLNANQLEVLVGITF